MATISICLPAIRQHLWRRLYDSIIASIGEHDFELVLCGPYVPSDDLLATGKVKHILDWGCPSRCHQRAILAAQNEIITWCPDDGWYLPGKLGQWVNRFLAMGLDSTNVLVTKYVEGNHLSPDASYYLNHHDDLRSGHIPNHYLIFNASMFWKQLFVDIGGLDCEFEGCAISGIDFGARAQRYGAKVSFWTDVTMEYEQCVGHAGDHGPIHDSQIDFDQPRYKQIWRSDLQADRMVMALDNWKSSPEKWSRRFG